MKMIGKKIAIYILVGILSVTVTMNAYSLGVHATGFEWVGGALAFEEALKWAMALLGVTATTGMTNAYWQEYGDDFVDYATENGATQEEVAEWQMKLCEGILDKGSTVWTSFKSWVKSLVSNSSSGGENGLTSASLSDLAGYLYTTYGIVVSTAGYYDYYKDREIQSFFIDIQRGTTYFIYCMSGKGSVSGNNISMGNGCWVSYASGYDGSVWRNFNNQTLSFEFSDSSRSFIFSGVSNPPSGPNITIDDYFSTDGTSGGTTADENFQTVQGVDQDRLDVISSLVPDENASEVTIPMPGVSDSDDTASADAYDEIVDQINSGTLSLEDGLANIQEILKVIVYDEVTDEVVPPQIDPDTGENKTKDDAIRENKDNMSFTLGGLETVFPFCIPWDIYAFISILEAEPVAPKFQFPFRDPTTKQDVMYEVDLSVFEPVAVVVRYGADLIFIIGLALATRKLIGAGGGE